ncbi:hypothetical protein HY745_13530 [Candidatus Desantisbacteria bacterium]|nr:hypothetical protein [Candidatus Desantisbacteria bacterium]
MNKIKLLEIIIIFILLIFSTTTFSQSHYDSTKISLEIQEQRDKLKIISADIEDLAGKTNLYAAKMRISGVGKNVFKEVLIAQLPKN